MGQRRLPPELAHLKVVAQVRAGLALRWLCYSTVSQRSPYSSNRHISIVHQEIRIARLALNDAFEIALKPEPRLGLLRLRGTGRVRVRFPRNLLLRFRRLGGVEFFIGSATAEDHRSAGEENQTHGFHALINNSRSSDFQRRCWFSELASLQDALSGDSSVTCTVNFEKSTVDFGQPLLGQRQVLVQPVFEDVADGGEIEIVS